MQPNIHMQKAGALVASLCRGPCPLLIWGDGPTTKFAATLGIA